MSSTRKLEIVSLQVGKGLDILYEKKCADLDAVNLFTLAQGNLKSIGEHLAETDQKAKEQFLVWARTLREEHLNRADENLYEGCRVCALIRQLESLGVIASGNHQ
jgi:hypothetical protein